jgi:3-oxoacyl-[acyl-carrier protein] reductase
MDLGIKGKRALVTGAGRGIGRAIALALAKEGAEVCVVARTGGDIQSIVDEMGGINAGHSGIFNDLEQPEGPNVLLTDMAMYIFGPVDIVVHNLGGTLGIRDPFCPIEDWRRVMRLNFEVAVELNQSLIPLMQERGWGRVVNIASTASVENNGPITYCAAKAALLAYSRGMGRILAPDGVVMSAVLPGTVLTEGGDWERNLKERPEHVKKYMEERLPLKRFGTPEEIAGIVTFLCSEQATFFQGAAVPVDGGQLRGYSI